MKITLAQTWQLACEAHAGQVEKNGNPYYTHLAAVWKYTRAIGGDVYAQHAAILHDIVEDTPVTVDDLYALGYSWRVVEAVQALSKGKGEPNRDYVGRVIEEGPRASIVKLADLYHNTEPARLSTLPKHTQDRLKYKYFHAIRRIEEALSLPATLTDEEYDASQTYQAPRWNDPVGSVSKYSGGWSYGTL